jgi:hypothetical protein
MTVTFTNNISRLTRRRRCDYMSTHRTNTECATPDTSGMQGCMAVHNPPGCSIFDMFRTRAPYL